VGGTGGNYKNNKVVLYSDSSSTEYVPPPLHDILDVNMDTRGVIFECLLGRDARFEIVDGGDKKGPLVAGRGLVGSKAEMLGITLGDKSLPRVPRQGAVCGR